VKPRAPWRGASYTSGRMVAPREAAFLALSSLVAALAGCRDVSGFTSHGDHFEGLIVQADFVRSGFDVGAKACVVIDTDHLQDGPGTLSTSDGMFQLAPLRPIPQIWHDPLSTLSFGEGRTKNLVYVVTPALAASDGGGGGNGGADVLAVLSLMDSGSVEVRLLRGAPAVPAVNGAPPVTPSAQPNLFAVFTLERQQGACPF
jgi:hypothetical protein